MKQTFCFNLKANQTTLLFSVLSFKLKGTGCLVRTKGIWGWNHPLCSRKYSRKNDTYIFSLSIKIIYFEVSIFNKKWFLLGTDKLLSQRHDYFREERKLAMVNFSHTFEYFLLIGDFDITLEIEFMNDSSNTFCLKRLKNEPACFKSGTRSCVDLILTNKITFCNVNWSTLGHLTLS